MNTYIIYFPNGEKIRAEAKNSMELVKKYDLATKENISVKISQISGNNTN
jgi:hypothetical protein